MINIYEPTITKYSKSAIDAINSGWISNHGKYIELANQNLCKTLDSKYSVLLSNGTCATHCLFLAIQYKHPEIIKIYVPNNAYVAAWNSALMVYKINQLEVMKMNINTWNIETNEEYFKTLDANSAVLIVHNLGNIINVPRLKKIRPDLIFVEDNCEGLFGKYNDIYSGTSSDILCSSVSFYGNKIITTGEGGAFLTNHQDVYEHIKKVYSQGMSSVRYLHDVHAYNYRMTNIQSAFLYDQLNDIEEILQNKKRIFSYYEKLLDFLITDGKIELFKKEENTENANWIFAIRIVGNTKTIEETTNFFKDNNVDIRPFFYPINSHKHLSSIKNEDGISYMLNREIIMIPSSPSITMEEQQQVVDVVFKFLLYVNNIKAVKINETNLSDLNNFIPTIKSNFFRYYNNRTIDCVKNHFITYLFFNTIKNTFFGYTHIDYFEKHWFGIYLHNEYCGKNIGGMMLNYTLFQCNNTNIDEISLSVDVCNENAIKLYKKNKFIIDNEEQDVFYIMRKKIN
jgi:perosamine synthetase